MPKPRFGIRRTNTIEVGINSIQAAQIQKARADDTTVNVNGIAYRVDDVHLLHLADEETRILATLVETDQEPPRTNKIPEPRFGYLPPLYEVR